MSYQAAERGRVPFAETNPVENAASRYLQQTEGNPSAALRLAVAHVLTLNHLMLTVGAGASWGFLRRQRSDLLRVDRGSL